MPITQICKIKDSARKCKAKGLCANTLKVIVSATAVLAMSACSSGGSGDSGNNGDNGGGGNASILSGTWDSCRGGFRRTFEFTDTRWVDRKASFATEDCSGPVPADDPFKDFVFEGTYEFVGTDTAGEGLTVQVMNLTSDTFDGSPVFDPVTQYTIVYTGTPNQLIFGDFAGIEANRPTQLEFDEPFVRR